MLALADLHFDEHTIANALIEGGEVAGLSAIRNFRGPESGFRTARRAKLQYGRQSARNMSESLIVLMVPA